MGYELDRAGVGRLEGYFEKRIGKHLRDHRKRESFAMYALGLVGEGERKSAEPDRGACLRRSCSSEGDAREASALRWAQPLERSCGPPGGNALRVGGAERKRTDHDVGDRRHGFSQARDAFGWGAAAVHGFGGKDRQLSARREPLRRNTDGARSDRFRVVSAQELDRGPGATA